MRREYRVRKVGDRYFPEFRYWIFFWNWRRFYYTRGDDLYDEALYMINFKTEEEAWDFIKKKKEQKRFSSYETRVSI
jgi:hypothetical protein